MDELRNAYEVVVVGGGAAGLSGAVMLARARRSVVVLDAGAPRNAPAEGAHGLLGLEGINPLELLERGRGEVRQYGGQVVSGEVTGASRAEDGSFEVTLADGRTVGARRLLVTTGLVDELPDVPGLRERWGKDVIHCPYCHGWEAAKDRAVGVLGSGPMSVHQALLFRQWTDDVTYFAHERPPSEEEAEQLVARGVRIVPGEVASVETSGDRLAGVRLADGRLVERETVVVASRMVARAGFLESLGLRVEEHPAGAGVGEYVPSEAGGRTSAEGVWVAGNVTDLTAQVGAAAAAGAMAGAQINADLVTEETRLAVEAQRAPFSAESEAEVAELVAGERRHGL